MHSNLAISRAAPRSYPLGSLSCNRMRPSGLADRKHVELVLRRETHGLQSHTCLSANDVLRNSWIRLERELNSSSLGMVYRPGPRSHEVAELLGDGFNGAPLPGAISVIGCDNVLLSSLAKHCCDQPRPYRVAMASQRYIIFEVPPVLMFVDRSDRSLPQAMLAAEELKMVDVNVEIVISSPDWASQHERIRAFFQTHLIRHFPRIF